MSSYYRVIPRDLFNEAKLLKCWGQMCLAIHDGRDCKGQPVPTGLSTELDDDARGFQVHQNPDTGELYLANLILLLDGHHVPIASSYNSRLAYPLVFEFHGAAGFVFNEDGSFTKDFLIAMSKERT